MFGDTYPCVRHLSSSSDYARACGISGFQISLLSLVSYSISTCSKKIGCIYQFNTKRDNDKDDFVALELVTLLKPKLHCHKNAGVVKGSQWGSHMKDTFYNDNEKDVIMALEFVTLLKPELYCLIFHDFVT